MIATYRDHTVGTFGEPVQITAAPGLEDYSADAPAVTGASDGASAGPLRLRPRSWMLDLVVLGDSAEEVNDELDDLYAAWLPDDDRTAQHPFDFTIEGQDPRTLFARCTGIQVGTAFDTADRRIAASVQVAFEALDPQAYAEPVETDPLDPSDTTVIVGTLPSSEPRWKLVVSGPSTNPQIASSIGAWAVVRYVGEVGEGESLVLDVSPRGLVTKLVDTTDLADYTDREVGENVYGSLDGGAAASNRPPQWFPLDLGSQTITFSASAGAGTAELTYWLPVR